MKLTRYLGIALIVILGVSSLAWGQIGKGPIGGGGTGTMPAVGASGEIIKSDGSNWISSDTLNIPALDLGASTSSVPWPVGTASAPTGEGRAYWNSTTNTLTIGDGAAAVALAPAVSPSFTTPTLGAATATSVLATGIVDGTAPIVITATSSSYQVGATYKSGYTFLSPVSSSAANSAILPTAATGLQYCIGNDSAKTGTLTVYTKNLVGVQYIDLDGVLTANTGGIQATAVAGNFACFVGMSTTTWKSIPTKGTWTKVTR